MTTLPKTHRQPLLGHDVKSAGSVADHIVYGDVFKLAEPEAKRRWSEFTVGKELYYDRGMIKIIQKLANYRLQVRVLSEEAGLYVFGEVFDLHCSHFYEGLD